MKITIYTITDCQFSKQEKEYLLAHNLQYEEKNLEINREYLTEMLAISNNFAGTPVTKLEKDSGEIVVLKGFTKEEFDKTLGFEVAPATPAASTAPVAQPAPVAAQPTPAPVPTAVPTPVAAPTPVTPAPVMPTSLPTPPSPTAPSMYDATPEPEEKDEEAALPPEPPTVMPDITPVMPSMPIADVSATTPAAVTPQSAAQDDTLNAILNSLQSKAGLTNPTGAPTQPANTPPTIPEPDFGSH